MFRLGVTKAARRPLCPPVRLRCVRSPAGNQWEKNNNTWGCIFVDDTCAVVQMRTIGGVGVDCKYPNDSKGMKGVALIGPEVVCDHTHSGAAKMASDLRVSRKRSFWSFPNVCL